MAWRRSGDWKPRARDSMTTSERTEQSPGRSCGDPPRSGPAVVCFAGCVRGASPAALAGWA
jgi:hypothetical protein